MLEDSRLKAVSKKIGSTMAIGSFVRIIFLAKHYWVSKKKLIPIKIYRDQKFPQEFLIYDLVTERENGYYVRGSQEHFEFLFKKPDSLVELGEKVKEHNKHVPNRKVDMSFLDDEILSFIHGVSDRIRSRWLKDYSKETIERQLENAMEWARTKGIVPKNVALLMNKFFSNVPKDNSDECPLDDEVLSELSKLGGDNV